MKRMLAAGLVLLSLLLTGCDTWMDGNYVSIQVHEQQQEQIPSEVRTISSFHELVSAMTHMVEYGRKNGVFIVEGYDQKMLSMDLPRAELLVRIQDPLGAYAVDEIETDIGVKGGQTSLAVAIEYRHSKTEIMRIKDVSGIESAKKAVFSALNQLKSGLVLRVDNYENIDFEQAVFDYAMQYPEKVIEVPKVTVMVYPNFGEVRVVELKFAYQTSRDSLRNMQNLVAEVFESAGLYISGDTTNEDRYTHLYSFLAGRYDYLMETSITPSYSLLCHGVGDSKAFATVFSAMCRQTKIPCMVVTGTRDGEPWYWNIIYYDNDYYHLDLSRCIEDGAMAIYPEQKMKGYVWDYSSYPSSNNSRPGIDFPLHRYPAED